MNAFSKKINLTAVASALFAVMAQPTFAGAEVKDGSLKAKSDDNKFQVGGRVMLDFDSWTDIHGLDDATLNDGSDVELRRGRVYVKSDMGDWSAKVQINVNDAKQKANLEDAYLRYEGNSAFKLTIGKQKEPFGLEELTSSKYISIIERSMMTNVFAPGKNYGVNVNGHSDNMTWAAGIFDNGNNSEGDQVFAFTARATFTPMNESNNLVHLGAAATTRTFDGNTFGISERAEVHLAEKIITSADTAADTVTIYGVEGAWNYDSFSVQAEYQMADVSAEVGEDVEYSGYYVQGSYFLTGESRPYSKKTGAFGKVKPNAATGAWELVARYSYIDAEDLDLGTEGKNATVGVNYYANNNVRFMFNYIMTDVDLFLEDGEASDDGDAISLRAQYTF